MHALKLNPQNVKAAYRGAKASSLLKHWPHVIEFCSQGLKVDADNADLRNLLDSAVKSRDKEDAITRKALVEKTRQRRALEQRSAAVDALGLVTGTTMPAHAEAISSASVNVDSSGAVSFPVLLLYDEVGQSDFVQYELAASCYVQAPRACNSYVQEREPERSSCLSATRNFRPAATPSLGRNETLRLCLSPRVRCSVLPLLSFH
jgi:hypothetical protein